MPLSLFYLLLLCVCHVVIGVGKLPNFSINAHIWKNSREKLFFLSLCPDFLDNLLLLFILNFSFVDFSPTNIYMLQYIYRIFEAI